MCNTDRTNTACLFSLPIFHKMKASSPLPDMIFNLFKASKSMQKLIDS